jgi:hypothetical protein
LLFKAHEARVVVAHTSTLGTAVGRLPTAGIADRRHSPHAYT